MKQLFLFRHAKTEPISFFQTDFERRLIEKGIDDMSKVSNYFQTKYIAPEIILYSNANRTTETFELFSKLISFKNKSIAIEELYHASASDILNIIEPFEKEYKNIMLIGHNFGISTLANALSAKGCESLSPGGMAIFNFENKIELYKGELIDYIKPKNI